jgi:hypothetical protein
MEANIDELFANTFFLHTWNELKRELYNLMKTYPNWNDVYELGYLGKSILTWWKHSGILPENSGEQMYIDVPI